MSYLISEPLGDITLYATDQEINIDDVGFEFDLDLGQPKTGMFQQIFSCEGNDLAIMQERPTIETISLYGKRTFFPISQTNEVKISGFTDNYPLLDFELSRYSYIILTHSSAVFIFCSPVLVEILRNFEAHGQIFIEFILTYAELRLYPQKRAISQYTAHDIEIGPRTALPLAQFDIEL